MKFMKKSDIIIIFIILFISVVCWLFYQFLFADSPARVEIYYKSKLIQTIDLNKGTEKTFSIPQNSDVVFRLDKDGKISFIKSDCQDKICIRSGKLHIVGQSAACLPNEIIIKVVRDQDGEKNEPDIVVK